MKVQEYTVEVKESGFRVGWRDQALHFRCSVWFHSGEIAVKLWNTKKHPKGGFVRVSGPFKETDDDFDAEGISNIRSKRLFRSDIEDMQVVFFDNAPGMAWRRTLHGQDSLGHVGGFIEKVTVPKESCLYPSESAFCFHAENPRLYNRYCMAVLEDRTKHGKHLVDAYDEEAGTFWVCGRHYRPEVGRSPFQPFPAIIYGNYKGNDVLMDATLTQKRLYRYYECKKTEDGYAYFWTQRPKTVNAVVIDPGEPLTGEWNYLEFAEKGDLNHPFDGYVRALENFPVRFRGRKSDNCNYVVWGSYNAGVYTDFDQERILKTADFIEENFPTVKWIQIDDGYDDWDHAACPGTMGRSGIGVAYHTESTDKKKFPKGIRAFTDEIKKRGLHPALWVGLYVGTGRQPYIDHPEWFIPHGTDQGCAILDLSKKEVRDFIQKAYERFIKEWGFEGVKFDFWSYLFEEEIISLPSGRMTGIEYRTWYMKTVRDLLPEYGYIQTGCDVAMANPHLGLYADNYRYGIDIGRGVWSNVVVNARWAAFCVNTHSGHLFIPNSDAIGIMPGLGDVELRTHINFCLISRTTVEIAGWLHKDKDHPVMPFMQKACCCPKNGEKVYFGNFDFTATDDIPAIWYLKTPHFSPVENSDVLPVRTFAVFNWSEQNKPFDVTSAALGLDEKKEYRVKDFWSDTVEKLSPLQVMLAPHESRLYSVLPLESVCGILDANACITRISPEKAGMTLDIEGSGQCELVLRRKPMRIRVNDTMARALTRELKDSFKTVFPAKGRCRVCMDFA